MKRAFVSGRYYRGEFVTNDAKGNVVEMRSSITPTIQVEEKKKVVKEIRIEPWIRKALDDQNHTHRTASYYVAQ